MTENTQDEKTDEILIEHAETESDTPAVQPRDRRAMALTGLILGIASIFFTLIPVIGLIVGILGIIFGALGLRSSRRKSAGWGLGLSVAGVILSFFTFVMEIAALLTTASSSLHG